MRCLLVLAAAVIPLQEDLDELRKGLVDEDDSVRARAVRALGKMGRLEATRLLIDILDDPSPYVRDWCFVTLTRIEDAASIEFLVTEGMRRPEARIRFDLAEWAGEGRIEAAVPALTRLLQDPSAKVRGAAVQSLAGIGDRSALPAIEGRMGEGKTSLRARVLLALGRLGGEEAAGPVRRALSDRSWEMRVAAIVSARGSLPREEAIEAAIEGIGDRSWPVRAAAIELLARLRDRRCVEPLIGGLEAKGRLRHDAHEALIALTGKEIPLDPVLWRAWWRESGDSFDPPTGRPPRDPRKTRTRLRYHGLPVVSHRIAFVLDLSGSMREPVGGEGGPSRLSIARKEVSRVIGELPREAVFNVYFYNEEVRSWNDRAARATAKARAAAIAFVNRQEARGYTNLYGALRAALEDLEVDTIYLLSDGGPSRGEVIFKERILRRVGERNRIRRVVIHTIDTGSGKRHQKALLRGLAESSGGRYVRLDGEGDAR